MNAKNRIWTFSLSILFAFFSIESQSQKVHYPENLSLIFSMPDTILTASESPILQIRFLNKSEHTIYLHEKLIDGELYDSFGNLIVELKILTGDSLYKPMSKKSVRHFYSDSFDAPKRKYKPLLPKSSITLEYDLFNVFAGSIEKGKYMVKLKLLAIPSDVTIKHDMYYYESNWIYFESSERLDGSYRK